jgi:type III secretion system FlhB-like substrate exporter
MFIPEHTYQAVADILKWENSLKKTQEEKITELFK